MDLSAGPSVIQYRRFGRTGLSMPVFTCGGMRFQDGWEDKPLPEIDPASQHNLETVIEEALQLGICHIETARGYGSSERQLGQILPRLPRENLIIQTKVSPNPDPAIFREEVLDSLDRLRLQHVDLLALHGINNEEKLQWSLRPGGCFDQAQRLRDEGRCRFVGFSTHGSVEVIRKAIEHGRAETGHGFDYVNLHWYYIYQETWPCIEAAARRDMGVFIISPSDKGGHLYAPPDRLRELCAPFSPMAFNDLYCLMHPQVHTLSVGAARPSDFHEHLQALGYLDETTPQRLAPVLKRLRQRYDSVVEPGLRDPWSLGLPPLKEMPEGINVGRILQLRNLARAFDLTGYARTRYNLLGKAADWVPGQPADSARLAAARPRLEALLSGNPHRSRILEALEEAHDLLAGQAGARLSQSA